MSISSRTPSADSEILTAEISQATFGLKPSEHKKLKSLKKENLRDHMTDLELIFFMLGEASITEFSVSFSKVLPSKKVGSLIM